MPPMSPRQWHVLVVVVLSAGTALARLQSDRAKVLVYRGCSDASAAVAVDSELFVVADDEDNVLRLYRLGGPDLPIFSYDLTEFLEVDPEHPEADIEGATRLGQRIYWIASHGRNKDGKMRPSRYRFFATEFRLDGATISMRPVGKCCKILAHCLVKDRRMAHLGLYQATRFDAVDLPRKVRRDLAPKRQGLNIEALCASADGRRLFIGFRNPRPSTSTNRAMALVVPLENATDIVERGALPVFGQPILWDLGGLGIRAMEYSSRHKAYFIVAGSHDESGNFALYRWSGDPRQQPVPLGGIVQSTLTPETLVIFEDSEKIFVLSDDGTLPVKVSGRHECVDKDEYRQQDQTCPNKYLVDPYKKTFRAFWFQP